VPYLASLRNAWGIKRFEIVHKYWTKNRKKNKWLSGNSSGKIRSWL